MTTTTLTEFIFTFGSGHRLRATTRTSTDPGRGINLDGWFVAIPAEDRHEAREVMFALFGDCWSFDYAPTAGATARERAGTDEFGMRELDIAAALADLYAERRAMSGGGPLLTWAEYRKRVQPEMTR